MAKSRDGITFLIVVSAIVLLSDPRCTGGCRTLAEHLFRHGLQRFFGQPGG